MDVYEKLNILITEMQISQKEGLIRGKNNQLIVWPNKEHSGYILTEKIAAEYIFDRLQVEPVSFFALAILYGLITFGLMLVIKNTELSNYFYIFPLISFILLFLRVYKLERKNSQIVTVLVKNLWEQAKLSNCKRIEQEKIKAQIKNFSLVNFCLRTFGIAFQIVSISILSWYMVENLIMEGSLQVLLAIMVTSLSLWLYSTVRNFENNVYYEYNNNSYEWDKRPQSYEIPQEKLQAARENNSKKKTIYSFIIEEAQWMLNQWPLYLFFAGLYLARSNLILL